MEKRRIKGLVIAGTGSGCGKTTVTCGILKALHERGKETAAFKCGPDYIDPMFHSEIIGTGSGNLDAFLCGENNLKYLYAKNSEKADIAVIEGVMGFYDGLGSEGGYSTYSAAKLTGAPVVLVVNPKGMALSVAAIIKGFRDFIPDNNIKGVIINSVAPGLYEMYRSMIEDKTGLRVYGFLPELKAAAIGSRHLGLITAAEIEDMQQKLTLLAHNTLKYVDMEGLLELAESAEEICYEPVEVHGRFDLRIAVARDRAFCFYYRDSLELLERLGAELVYFSPLSDRRIPENVHGLILGGGYPELFAGELSKNAGVLSGIKAAVEGGMPVYAECGGFMYLQETITDAQKNSFTMAGVLRGNSFMQNKLSRFGYITLTAKADNLLCRKGERINAHEFHYSDSDKNGGDFEAMKPDGKRKWECIFADETMAAGYPHMHFYGNTGFAESFLQKCSEFKKTREDK
ncbi:cobyrinic acid A,C-diamide synthase [Ruminiclostridium hungatei]|uniref:Cobyrinate a,c-diamide synthase n=1 Tax=Ruminiclostridium hungatei TaxID=48256 RepID=A0A1V4SPE7_RUMHU|nr:cobyrinate a,c-diamide synthase [Ruminiclostridium hungatei]OPX45732.1 cobyrinic acid A,C-diamide synthase [Ruminiclostridium hungatei]